MDESGNSRSALGSRVRKDIKFYDFIKHVSQKDFIRHVIMVTILLNALFMALEADYDLNFKNYVLFQVIDEFFLAIYTMEFLIKVYVEPKGYWKSSYNIFDTFILILSYIPLIMSGSGSGSGVRAIRSLTMLRTIRLLRVLRTISYIRAFQVLILALFKALTHAVYSAILLFILVLLFAIIGHDFFGDTPTGDPQTWGDLGNALCVVFSLVTVDGWTDVQGRLDDLGFTFSWLYTIAFILLGYVIFYSMFVGAAMIAFQDATKIFEEDMQNEREASLAKKKETLLKRQQEELGEFIQSQETHDRQDFNERVEKFRISLTDSDDIVMEDVYSNLTFINTYLTSLDNQDESINRMSDFYDETIRSLSEILERRDLVEAEAE
ncbi:cation channel sperm-associated protein 3 isoform X1 [Amia ocellicauda]|uniref:cation channel sperm-associated protein 3 isoform X1 n=1 Tax=Amia ocellicauda TaxID=2972642 RepID=UPI0034638A73